MVFKNQKQLEEFLLQKCQNALVNAQEKVYEILDLYLHKFYADYDPTWYARTEQLLHSLVKGNIHKSGNSFVAEVYFDLKGLSYDGYSPSGEQVMAAASQGYHGAIGKMPKPTKFGHDEFQYIDPRYTGGTGVSIWNDPVQKLDTEAINILKNMLIAEGIPIK